MMIKDGNLANDKTTGGKGQSSSCAAIATLMETFIDVQQSTVHCRLNIASITFYAILDMAIRARAAAVQVKQKFEEQLKSFAVANANR